MSVDLIYLLKEKTQKKNPFFYNIMPIANIPSVINNGILSYNKAKKISHKSVASTPVQERRESVIIPNGGKLHDYANLYFTYHNPMMYKRRNEADELCVLAVNPSVIYLPGCVVSDQNASKDFVRFYIPEEGLKAIDFNLVFQQYWTNSLNETEASYQKAVKCAEVLIPNQIPYEYVVSACVVGEDSKRRLLEAGFDKPICVKSAVFYR